MASETVDDQAQRTQGSDGAPIGRRLLTVGVALLLAVGAIGAAGCGGDDDGDGETTATATETTTEETTAEETTTEEDGGGAEGSASAGQQVFAENCATCHGNDGSGGVGPNIQQQDNADEVREQVVNGGGGMPAFGDVLTEKQIADVTAFVVEDLGGG